MTVHEIRVAIRRNSKRRHRGVMHLVHLLRLPNSNAKEIQQTRSYIAHRSKEIDELLARL